MPRRVAFQIQLQHLSGSDTAAQASPRVPTCYNLHHDVEPGYSLDPGPWERCHTAGRARAVGTQVPCKPRGRWLPSSRGITGGEETGHVPHADPLWPGAEGGQSSVAPAVTMPGDGAAIPKHPPLGHWLMLVWLSPPCLGQVLWPRSQGSRQPGQDTDRALCGGHKLDTMSKTWSVLPRCSPCHRETVTKGCLKRSLLQKITVPWRTGTNDLR